MKTLKNIEAHSLNSLAKRLGGYVSRQTLKTWIDSGTIRPVLQNSSSRNSHLLFPTGKLNALREVLKQAHEQRLKKSGASPERIAIMRRNSLAAASHRAEENEKRKAAGKAQLPDLEPAMDDDAAQGVTRMTVAKEKIEGIR